MNDNLAIKYLTTLYVTIFRLRIVKIVKTNCSWAVVKKQVALIFIGPSILVVCHIDLTENFHLS
jgi:hypothetical protein